MPQPTPSGVIKRVEAVFADVTTGAGVTGLTPVVRVFRTVDSTFLNSDGTYQATPAAEYAASAAGATYQPGLYYFNFNVPNDASKYSMRFDGGTGISPLAMRYRYGTLDSAEVFSAISVLPIAASIADALASDTTIKLYKGTNAPDILFTLYESDGTTPLDLSGYTVTFYAYDRTGTQITAEGVVSGADNNIITVSYTTTDTAEEATYSYSLIGVNGGTTQVLASGILAIAPTPI